MKTFTVILSDFSSYIPDTPPLPHKPLAQDPAPRRFSTHPYKLKAGKSFGDHPALTPQLTKGGPSLWVLSSSPEKGQLGKTDNGGCMGFRGPKRLSSRRRERSVVDALQEWNPGRKARVQWRGYTCPTLQNK